METVKGIFNNGELTMFLSGSLSSLNAAETEAELVELRKKFPDGNVVVDAEKLEYISSAGLRIVLRLRKENPQLKIVNASSAVYEVLEMTGFTEMMTVEKAYRRLSVEGCEAIGQGANGVVYRLDPDTIIKVYRNPDSLPDIKRERELARRAFVLGIPTAIPYDVVRVGEGYGSVFEMLNAKSLAKLITADPDGIDKYIEIYIDLLKKLHSTEVKPGDMPSMKQVVLDWAEFLKDYLPEWAQQKIIALVSATDDRKTIVHGDYHIKNVMLQNGEALLIDMDTLSFGHPAFELAQMYLSYVGFGETDPTIIEKFMNLPYETTTAIWNKSLRRYLGTDDEAVVKRIENQIRIIAYIRLMRRTIRRIGLESEEGRALVARGKEQLEDLLKKVDTLNF